VSELVTAIGLVLVIEGLAYAISPGWWRDLAERLKDVPDETLRLTGMCAIGIGVFVVWIGRSVIG
jgi:uncharacterized protein YjeT (DUF2065 family)